MFQSIMLYLLFFFNTLFMFMKHPLSLSIILLIQTIIISIISGMMNKNFWFSYILFLIFIGAMLILFIYITSLSSNELFFFEYKMIIIPMTMTIIMLIWFKNQWNFTNADSLNIMFYNNNNINNSSLFMLFNFPLNTMIILLMIYLLFTLITIIKITKFFKGPLRMMN